MDDLEKGISKVKNMSKTDCKGIKNAGEAIGKNFDELLSPEVKKAEELASRVGKHGDDFAKIANKCGDAAAEAAAGGHAGGIRGGQLVRGWRRLQQGSSG